MEQYTNKQLSQVTLSNSYYKLKQSPPLFEEVKTPRFWRIKMPLGYNFSKFLTFEIIKFQFTLDIHK